MLTLLSVHWADRMTATISWKGLSKRSSLEADGMFCRKYETMPSNRSLRVIS